MKEYIKSNNALTSLIPYLKIESTLPVDGSEGELVFIPSDGIYEWQTNAWVQVASLDFRANDRALVGEVIEYYSTSAVDRSSEGWLLCDGSTKNYNDYPELALLIDPTLTPGSTFTLPDYRERYLTMIGTNGVANRFTNGDVYTMGEAKHQTVGNHTHDVYAESHNHMSISTHFGNHQHYGPAKSYIGDSIGAGNNEESDSQMMSSNSTVPKLTLNNANNVTISFGTTSNANCAPTFQTYGSKTQPKTVCCYYYIRAR